MIRLEERMEALLTQNTIDHSEMSRHLTSLNGTVQDNRDRSRSNTTWRRVQTFIIVGLWGFLIAIANRIW